MTDLFAPRLRGRPSRPARPIHGVRNLVGLERQHGIGQPDLPHDGHEGFWFFSPENLDLVVKVVDGRAVNGKFWVFYGSLTAEQFTLTVTDTLTGATKTYTGQGENASGADTSAF